MFDSTVRDESLAAILIPFFVAYDRESGQYVVVYSTDTGAGVSKEGKLAHRYVLLLLVVCSAGAGGELLKSS